MKIESEIEMLIGLDTNYNITDIDNLLNYFRRCFQESVYKYQGDVELYEIIKRCILQGNSFEDSCKLTKEIIDREFMFANFYYSIAESYIFNFIPENKEISLSSEDLKYLIKNFPRERRLWKIIFNRIEYWYYCIKQYIQKYLKTCLTTHFINNFN